MRSFYYRTYDEFAVDIGREYTHLECEYKAVSVIAKYEDARHIVEGLVRLGHPIISISLDDPEYCDYRAELVVTLDNEGVWCEPMKIDDRYLPCASDVIYIMGNCSILSIKDNNYSSIYEANVGEDEYEDTCEPDSDDEASVEEYYLDDNIHSFDVDWHEGDTSYRLSCWTEDGTSIEEKFREIVNLLTSNRNI